MTDTTDTTSLTHEIMRRNGLPFGSAAVHARRMTTPSTVNLVYARPDQQALGKFVPRSGCRCGLCSPRDEGIRSRAENRRRGGGR